MSFKSIPQFARWSCVFAQLAGISAGLLGVVVLAGWWLNIKALSSIIPGSAPMPPNAAAGILLCAAGLSLLSRKGVAQPVRICTAAVAMTVIALATLTLGELFLGWNLGIDQWLVRIPGAIGASHLAQMTPATAFCFFLIGSALFVESSEFTGMRLRLAVVGGLSGALVLIGTVALGGFFLEMLLGPRWNLMGMSVSGVTGSVGFLLLGGGLLVLLLGQRLRWSLDVLTSIGFTAGILLVVLAAGTAFSFTRQMLETTRRVSHRQEVLKETQGIMTGMADLASSERVYAIVGDERLLQDRRLTRAAVNQGVLNLRKLTADNSNQQRRLDQLGPLLAQGIDWEEQVIAVGRAQSLPAARQMIAAGRGLRLTEEIDGLLREMQNEEYRLLARDRREAKTTSITTFLFLPMEVCLSLAIVSLGIFFLNSGVTEQKQSEEALRENQAQLQTIVENLDEGVVVSDLSGRLLQWNRAALKLHGYATSEQDHRRFTELVDTFELSTLDGTLVPVEHWPLARILRGENVHDLELRVWRIGSEWKRVFNYGGTLVHDASNQPLMAIVTLSDITTRKRAEEMLRASEERYRELFESNPNPMWVYDLETLSFLAVNTAAISHYGYSQDEFLAMTIKDIRPPEDIAALMGDLSQKNNNLDNPTQWRHHKKDGALIDVEITSHEVLWLGRHAKLVLVNDITARKRAEHEILQLNLELEERVKARTADLEAANKELEAFSYSVSHDLRSPLRAVDGFSQAVLEDYGAQLPEEGLRYLQTIRDGAQRMGVLIDDLLTFSRLSRLPLRKQAVDMTKLVRAALEELNAQRMGRKIEIHIDALASCEGDPALLKQTWVNLLSNAIKYTRKREAAVIDVGYWQEKGEGIYFVRDNGTGFDMRYAHKLFGVFQRLHRADEFEGTGVGLAIVQRVVHRHGGRVWAEAAPDRGATFYFTMKGC